MTNDFWAPVLLTLQISLAAAVIAGCTGIAAAAAMHKTSFKGKLLAETAFMLPLFLPPTVVGFLLLILLGKGKNFGLHVLFTKEAAVCASVVVAFPLMYMAAKTGFSAVSEDVQEAARIDGARELQVFSRILLPLAAKALTAGLVLSFLRAMGEFGATLMVAGNIPGKTQTVATAVYTAMETGNTGMAALWASTLILVSFLLFLIVRMLEKS
ncbi:molybdate ABC transporter permease subunit [Metabacillus lacus]|uniref:molybdate ABC transporter permease subunit n=1 Tax=Metabacillus lacus TaxID=1983721 RepID=UPI0031B60809